MTFFDRLIASYFRRAQQGSDIDQDVQALRRSLVLSGKINQAMAVRSPRATAESERTPQRSSK